MDNKNKKIETNNFDSYETENSKRSKYSVNKVSGNKNKNKEVRKTEINIENKK